MPAYVVATMDIHDEAAYMQEYIPPVRGTIADHGGAVLAVMHTEVIEGKGFRSHNVILGFPSMDAALGWYRSPEYQEILPIRLNSTTSSAIAVEGTDDRYTPGSAYIIATMEVTDPANYPGEYAPAAVKTIGEHGGKVLVRGGATEFLEPGVFGSRTVILEFADIDAALGWYNSPEYQKVVGIRHAATDGSMIALSGLPS